MSFAADPGALLARSRDRAAIEALARHEGVPIGELDLARLLSADPRRQLAITATALIGSAETVVGFGAIDLAQPEALPTALVVDRTTTEGLDELLGDALRGRAQALHRNRAA